MKTCQKASPMIGLLMTVYWLPVGVLVSLCFSSTWACAETDLAPARALYESSCAECHGSNGSGQELRDSGIAIPDLSSSMWLKQQSSAKLRVSILRGKGDEMPAFEDDLSVSDVAILVKLIYRMAGLEPTENTRAVTKIDAEWQRLRNRWKQLFDRLKAIQSRRLEKRERVP